MIAWTSDQWFGFWMVALGAGVTTVATLIGVYVAARLALRHQRLNQQRDSTRHLMFDLRDVGMKVHIWSAFKKFDDLEPDDLQPATMTDVREKQQRILHYLTSSPSELRGEVEEISRGVGMVLLSITAPFPGAPPWADAALVLSARIEAIDEAIQQFLDGGRLKLPTWENRSTVSEFVESMKSAIEDPKG